MKMPDLVRKRGRLKTKLTCFTKFVKTLSEKEEITSIEIFQLSEKKNFRTN